MKLTIRLSGSLVMICIGLSTVPTLAQTERGVGWWAGGLGLSKENTHQFQDKNEQNTLTIALTQGLFVRDNFLLGADLRLARSRDLSRQGAFLDAVSDFRQTTFTATPFMRYFWGKQAIRGYVGGGVFALHSRDRLFTSITQTPVSERDESSWRISPEFQAGLFYAIRPRWGVEVSTRSGLLPLAFSSLNVGLVVLTDVKRKASGPPDAAVHTLLHRGNWVVGGGFEVATRQQQLTSGTDKQTTIQRQESKQYTISPSVGYMAGRRWQVGLAVPYRQQTLVNEFNRTAINNQVGTVETTSIGVEPFAKKYLFRGNFGPYALARAGWRSERVTGDGTAESRNAGYSWRVGAGLAYLLGSHFLIEGELAGLGSDWSSNAQRDNSARTTNIAITLRPAISVSYVLR